MLASDWSLPAKTSGRRRGPRGTSANCQFGPHVGGRIEELKELEARIGTVLGQRDEAEAARFKNVVTMYETMKAKDAAKIFDGLDLKILIDVARAINPRAMSEILAQMTPEKAQRLTAELAARPEQMDHASEMDLPKIQGRPAAN